MAIWIDVLDSVNQKYDNTTSGLTADNAQAALDELSTVAGNFADAEFPTYAVFSSLIAATATVDFSAGNKQSIADATGMSVTVASPAGHPANFTLKIGNSNAMVSITSATEGSIKWDSGSPPVWAGLSILSLFYDGSAWYGSAIVGAA